MEKDNTIFHLEFNRWLIEVKLVDKEKNIFNLHFLNEIPDLLIQRIPVLNGEGFWLSANDQMQYMTQPIGALID